MSHPPHLPCLPLLPPFTCEDSQHLLSSLANGLIVLVPTEQHGYLLHAFSAQMKASSAQKKELWKQRVMEVEKCEAEVMEKLKALEQAREQLSAKRAALPKEGSPELTEVWVRAGRLSID